MYINKVFQSRYWFFVLINDEEIKRYKTLKSLILCMAKRLKLSYKDSSKLVNNLLMKEMEDYSKSCPNLELEKYKLRHYEKEVLCENNLCKKKTLVELDIKAYLRHKGREYIGMAPNQIGYLLTFEIFADLRFRDLMTPQNYIEVLTKAKEAIENLNNEVKVKVINKLALECIPIVGLTRFDYSPCKLFINHLLTMVGFLQFA